MIFFLFHWHQFLGYQNSLMINVNRIAQMLQFSQDMIGGRCYYVFKLLCFSKVVLILIKQESFFKNWKKWSGTPLFTPPWKLFVRYFFNLFKVYGIQNDRKDQTKTMRKEKKKKNVNGAEKLTKNHKNKKSSKPPKSVVFLIIRLQQHVL